MFDYFSYWEKRATHSKYQFSTFNKAYVYLALNMLVIPAVTMNSQQSILKVLSDNSYNPFLIMGRFYSGDQQTAAFFASMLV